MKTSNAKYQLLDGNVKPSHKYLNAVILFFGISLGFMIAFLILLTPMKPDITPKPAHQNAKSPATSVAFPNFPDHYDEYEDLTLADKLFSEVRILCWVMTYPKNHMEKAIHVKNTWGKRCNKLLFMSSVVDPELGTIKLPMKEGFEFLWAKTKEAYKYLYEHHLDDADWFLKADDNTYVIVENLRYMLYQYSPDEAIHFGCKLKTHLKQGYMAGGPGYVLSKKAVIRFVEEGIPNKTICRQDDAGAEDLELGACLENLGIPGGDARDEKGRLRFMGKSLDTHLTPGWLNQTNYKNEAFYLSKGGEECCSDTAVSYHYATPNQMYVNDYLIYRLQPYGRIKMPKPLPSKKIYYG